MTASRFSARHPSARAQGADLALSVRSILARAPGPLFGEALSASHPRVALAAMAVRGRQHRSRAEFAAAYGIAEEMVVLIESGSVAASDVPDPLLHLTALGPLLWSDLLDTRPGEHDQSG